MKRLLTRFILLYLRVFAKIQLKKINPVIIGIGGASGKTSLSNLMYVILSQKYKVKQTAGKNSETGIPLNILGIKIGDYSYLDWFRVLFTAPLKILFDWKKFDFYIAEMGIDSPLEPKNMSYLLKIIKPNVAILTNITFEHSENFEILANTSEEIFKLTKDQELLLLKSLRTNDTAILNIDDPVIKQVNTNLRSKKLLFQKKCRQISKY